MILQYLEYNNLLNYLCSQGHFTFDDVIESDLSIKKKLTKNNTFEVYNNKKGVFVKQFTEFYKYPFNNLWRERLIRNKDKFYKLKLADEVKNAITKLESIDYDRQIIITERLAKLEYLRNLVEDKSQQELEPVVKSIISIIDKIHQTKEIKESLKRRLDFTPYFYDMILCDSIRSKDKTIAFFWSQFDNDGSKKKLDTFIKKRWSYQEALIHNDLSLSNILKNDNQIYIIDWEHLGIGDSLWDYASLIYDLDYRLLQSKHPNYKFFIEEITNSLSGQNLNILNFYVTTIKLWRLSLNLEKPQKSSERDKLLKESIPLIEIFNKNLSDIKL